MATSSNALRVGAAVVCGGLLVGVSAYASGLGSDEHQRSGNGLVEDWSARTEGQQVLGGVRTPGVPSVQRLQHDAAVVRAGAAKIGALPGSDRRLPVHIFRMS